MWVGANPHLEGHGTRTFPLHSPRTSARLGAAAPTTPASYHRPSPPCSHLACEHFSRPKQKKIFRRFFSTVPVVHLYIITRLFALLPKHRINNSKINISTYLTKTNCKIKFPKNALKDLSQFFFRKQVPVNF